MYKKVNGSLGMKQFNNPLYHYILICVVCFFAFFINNHVVPADYMESRNLATAQEMVSTSNYLIPTMNGELRLEKPPLPTWIAAGVEHIAPNNLVAQRYMAGLAATMMVIFLYLLVYHFTRRRTVGLLSALVLASCYNVVMMGRTVSWDIYCHAFMLGGIYFLVMAIENDGRQWGRFIMAGVFIGLSFLSKGPVSFYALLLPFLICYIAYYRPSIKGKYIPLVLMIVIALGVSFWWNLYILVFHKAEMLAVVEQESSSWVNRSVKPFYYYWQFPVEAGIWTLFWVTSLLSFLWRQKKENHRFYFFSVIWTLAALVLLSAIPEKKTRYLLPMLIPGAVNIALYFYYIATNILSKSQKNIFRANAVILAILTAAIPLVLYFMFIRSGQFSVLLFIVVTVVCLAICVYILLAVFNKEKLKVWNVFASALFIMFIVETMLMAPIGKIFINNERHSINQIRDDMRVKSLPFYYVEDEFLRMELVYEVNKIIRPINISDEDEFYQALPLVLLSGQPAEVILEGKNVRIEYIDRFDNNWQQPTSKRHNKDLVRYVSVVYPD